MRFLDWMIVFLTLSIFIFIAVYTKRFMKSVSDFLAAGRCAGRYLLCVAQGMAAVGAITIVAKFEMFYAAGFTATWWLIMNTTIMLMITLSGWVFYRYRETRVFTLAQFFEIRYSRGVRIVAGIIGWLSGILNYGIFPAVEARFFIYFCNLPETVPYLGISTFALIMVILLLISLYFVFLGGQITILVIDFVQGTFTYLVLLVIIGIFFLKFDWASVMQTLQQAPENASMLHPFKTSQIKEFNVFYFIIIGLSLFYVRLAWQGSQGFACSAKNAHEAKMGLILGGWRDIVMTLMLVLLPIAAYVVLHNQSYSQNADSANSVLAKIADLTIRKQVTVSVILKQILPVGVVGLFVSIMLAASISTHSSYMHSWGSIFIQDVIMPFRKEPFSQKQHILLLKLSVAFVALFIFLFSLFFNQNQEVLLYCHATAGIFAGGAGALIIGGLYWKRGTTKGAYVALFTGSIFAIVSIAARQIWVPVIYPYLAQSAPGVLNGLKNVIEGIANNIPGINWKVEQNEFPFNGQWIFCFTIILSVLGYLSFSLLDWLMLKKPAHDLDKLLHRGEYAIAGEHGKNVSKPATGWRALFPSQEFTLGDKLIYYFKLTWGLGWAMVFIIGVIINVTRDVPVSSWVTFWNWNVGISIVVGVITTIWFSLGGVRDVIRMFATLKGAKRDDSDVGFIKRQRQPGKTDAAKEQVPNTIK
ncbi:MAG: hypothetical protein A2Y10_09120 [Planctomycetes bacterium GWF2_41_51]|nr:MAG: hypothetical protein A2Y10_09120 [Planctomycetes bacterium GWF2_41_51]HBG26702.1 sodium:solute symporter [Phycisphaerales bacterium]